MAGLGPKAAVVLVQLPARFRFDPERLDRFCSSVARRRKRHALEPRDASWLTDDAVAALRERRVALCVIDTPKWPTRRRDRGLRLPTLSWSDPAVRGELRRRCVERLGGTDPRLAGEGLDIYAYFNNDERAYAPRDALRLRELVG